jgi:hypothetical protein
VTKLNNKFDLKWCNIGFYNTLDIDWLPTGLYTKQPCDKDTINRITAKISKCPNLLSPIEITDGHTKGYHLRFYCSIPCNDCRWIEDPIRFAHDLHRPAEFRNVIFTKKATAHSPLELPQVPCRVQGQSPKGLSKDKNGYPLEQR